MLIPCDADILCCIKFINALRLFCAMKVLVINPPTSREYSRMQRCHGKVDAYNLTHYDQIPVDLLYVGAIFKKHRHDVEIIDFSIRKRFIEFSERLKNLMSSIDMIVVNSANPVIKEDYQLIQTAKAKGIKTILIGELCNFGEVELMNLYKDIDICVRGEIEAPFEDIAKGKKISEIESITFRENNKIVKNKYGKFCDLDNFPIPARKLTTWKDYIQPSDNEPYTVITVSRGCPYNCTFCQNAGFSGKKPRYRSVESVIEEIMQCLNIGIRNFFFRAENFTLDKSFVSQLCRQITKRKIYVRWSCSTRVDLVCKSLLKEMKKAGCWLVHYGVECADETALKELNKNCSEKQIEEAVKASKELGILVHASFVYGIGNDKERMVKNFRLIKKYSIDFPAFFKLKAFKGTGLKITQEEIDKLLDEEFYEMIRQFSLYYYLSLPYLLNMCRNILQHPRIAKGLIMNGPKRVRTLIS
jgi:anaerobic magnesium-protoporphyrin IX monomethyl ester cyclase